MAGQLDSSEPRQDSENDMEAAWKKYPDCFMPAIQL